MSDSTVIKPIIKDPVTGRFLKGTSGGKGRPKDNQYAQARDLFNKIFNAKLAKRVLYRMVNDALGGNTKAQIFLLEQKMGKIPDALEITHKTEEKQDLDAIRSEFDLLFRNKSN